MMLRTVLAAALVGGAAVLLPCDPNIARCDPASPLFDATLCYRSGHGGGYSCDPYGDAYDPNYCASQRSSR
jgi:hypothetical protein